MFGSSLFIFDLYEIYALFYTYIIRIYLRMLVSSTISLLKKTDKEFQSILVKWSYGWFMVFNATYSNISIISWRSVLLVEETRVPGENFRYNFNLQLPMQSVPITTKVLSSRPVHGDVYSIQCYVKKFVSDFRQVGGFLRELWFPPPIMRN
jgi:hypothetical protein